MDYAILISEIQNDPLARGYAGMTDAQRLASLSVKNRPTERGIVPAYEVLEAIVPSEWASLSAAEKQRVQVVVSAGQVNLKGGNTRAMLGAAFGAGTTTRDNLIALQAGPPQSRAQELGIADVGMGHLVSAREMLVQPMMLGMKAHPAVKMHPHQLELLVQELRSPAYDGANPREALALVNDRKVLRKLGSARFDSEELKARFPSGVPGFPNRVFPADFDVAWQQAGRK